MAVTHPAGLISGYTIVDNGTDGYGNSMILIQIPIYSFNGALTAAEVNPDSGDGRKVLFELIKSTANNINRLPVADRPKKLTITKTAPQGVDGNTIRQSYTLTFDLDISAVDVSGE